MTLGELLLILIVALIVIKPERLPEAARLLGKGIRWSRKIANKYLHYE